MIQKQMMERLSERINEQSGNLRTEEATKHALVLPFLTAMGYDVFDPNEVIPEYTADLFMKNGEKVDYAIMRNENPAILIECKKVGDSLDINRASQLGRYFNAADARIGILTDGVRHLFFSGLEQQNRMDTTPFLAVNFSGATSVNFNSLRHFAKETFNPEEACEAAANMKYIDGIQTYLEQAYANPPEELVRMIAKQIYQGPLTTSRRQKFTHLTKVAFQGFINNRVSNTLRKASDIAQGLANDDQENPEDEIQEEEMFEQDILDSEPGLMNHQKEIITTAEEIEAHEIIRMIVDEIVEPDRVTIKDTKSYCNILLDQNNRKPICRLFLDSVNAKHMTIMSNKFDEKGRRTSTKYSLSGLSEIPAYEEEIKQAVQQYLEEPSEENQGETPEVIV